MMSDAFVNTPSKLASTFVEKESEVPSLIDKQDALTRKSKEVFASAEKFKENEKNLNEDRLKKESKIEIPLTLESRKLGKSSTPMQINADEIINEANLKESPLKQT